MDQNATQKIKIVVQIPILAILSLLFIVNGLHVSFKLFVGLESVQTFTIFNGKALCNEIIESILHLLYLLFVCHLKE